MTLGSAEVLNHANPAKFNKIIWSYRFCNYRFSRLRLHWALPKHTLSRVILANHRHVYEAVSHCFVLARNTRTFSRLAGVHVPSKCG